MPNDNTADIAIIGAGVVGCAIARELSLQYPGKQIVVIEKLSEAGRETSSRNSGVLHSGLHQDPRMLKSKLALIGNRLTVAYHEQKGLPLLHTGMIVAVSQEALRQGLWREAHSLIRLINKGRTQKIKFEYLTGRGLRAYEPRLSALGGIFIPSVWVIDFVKYVQSLKEDALRNGVQFLFHSSVASIEQKDRRFYISAGANVIAADAVINSAGLSADEVAHMAGFSQYKIFPWRGEYCEITGESQKLVKRLIYPAVHAGSPGKGIHLSPRVDGRLFIGPNARLVPRKDYYEEDKTPVEAFWRAAHQFLPELRVEDVRWAYSGIRAKITDKEKETDFIISLDSREPPFINLIGIESPGLTAALAIAQHVSSLVSPHLIH
jgi:glycerol-3-phosphate dehydrogenase